MPYLAFFAPASRYNLSVRYDTTTVVLATWNIALSIQPLHLIRFGVMGRYLESPDAATLAGDRHPTLMVGLQFRLGSIRCLLCMGFRPAHRTRTLEVVTVRRYTLFPPSGAPAPAAISHVTPASFSSTLNDCLFRAPLSPARAFPRTLPLPSTAPHLEDGAAVRATTLFAHHAGAACAGQVRPFFTLAQYPLATIHAAVRLCWPQH